MPCVLRRTGILSVQLVISQTGMHLFFLFFCVYTILKTSFSSLIVSPAIVPELYFSFWILSVSGGGARLDKHSPTQRQRKCFMWRHRGSTKQRRPEMSNMIQAISCTFTSSKPLVSGGGSWLLSMEDSLPVLSPERSLVTLRSAFSVCTSFPMLISPKSLII